MKTLGNFLWVILGGFATAFVYYLIGFLYCITIIGFPFGQMHFKIALGSIFPFGKEIRSVK